MFFRIIEWFNVKMKSIYFEIDIFYNVLNVFCQNNLKKKNWAPKINDKINDRLQAWV